MKTRNRISTLIFVLVPILLFAGCNALKRGDFMRQSDNALFFTEIGFRVSDNPGLSRDAITTVRGTDRNIEVVVPYGTDTSAPLVISFNLTAKDATVGYWIGPGEDDFANCESGVTSLIFNSGVSPESQRLRIFKESSYPGGGDIRTEDYYINVNKIITPRLYSAPKKDEIAPFSIGTGNPFIVAFVDEDGTPLPNMDTNGIWNTDKMYLSWDGGRVHITNIFNPVPPPDFLAPPYTVGPPAGYQLDVTPIYPGEHRIQVFDGLYMDNQGYFSRYEELIFEYSPPPVFLSQSGNDSNNGLSKTTPVKSWSKAMAIADSLGIMDMYIEASATAYDTAGANLIDGLVRPMNIFGSWMPGFNSRYEDDWDIRPPTILTNSAQGNGVNRLNPSAVLIYQDVPNTAVLDGVQLSADSDINFGTALLLSNSGPLINQMMFQAPQGTGTDATAITVISGSYPDITDSPIVGKFGGTGISVGIRTDGSFANINRCLFLSGDFNGESIGIEAVNSDINLNYSHILSGVVDPDSDVFTEDINQGIRATDSQINMNGSWVHAWDANTLSEAVFCADDAGREIWINSSTLISERSGASTGLSVFSTLAMPFVHVFNSVVMAGKSTAGPSAGLRLENVNDAQVMNNAINVKDGATPGETYGIELTGPGTPGLDIRNNLIWSESTDQFLGIRSDNDISFHPIHNNDFWDTDIDAEVFIDGNLRSVAAAHNIYPNFYGNIGLGVSVDLSFDYPTEELDVGRINGTVPVDIQFGGEDLGGTGFYIPDFPELYGDPSSKMDRDSEQPPNPTRTGSATVGWSMGPYEYNSGSMPTSIYVAMPTNGGDDGHPLGTQDAPFASLARAYSLARTAPPAMVRTDVLDVRVAEGIYDTSSMPIISSGQGISLQGGYQQNTWVRNPSTYVTELQRNGPEVLVYDNAAVGPDHVLDGFTVKNTAASGTTDALAVRNGARPAIRNNILLAGSGAGVQSRGMMVQNSHPIVENNKIVGGNLAAESIGVFLLNALNSEIRGNDIVAGSGSLTKGIHLQGSDGAVIESNNIYGGDSTTDSYGIYNLSSSNINVYGNTISAGTGNNTYGISSQNPGYKVFDSNYIFGGVAGSNSFGIKLISSDDTRIINNIIHGGMANSLYSRGIEIDGGADWTYLYNNTIFGGRSASLETAVIRTFNGARPHVINNILVAGTGGAPVNSIVYWETSMGTPLRFLNNLLISIEPAGNPYRDSATFNYMDVPAMEFYLNGNGSTAAGNRISMPENPADYFQNFIPGNDDVEFKSENWRLSGGGIEDARNGGLNLSGDIFHAFNHDADGNGRTPNWSIGAYEF